MLKTLIIWICCKIYDVPSCQDIIKILIENQFRSALSRLFAHRLCRIFSHNFLDDDSWEKRTTCILHIVYKNKKKNTAAEIESSPCFNINISERLFQSNHFKYTSVYTYVHSSWQIRICRRRGFSFYFCLYLRILYIYILRNIIVHSFYSDCWSLAPCLHIVYVY